jgi:hypothetical protein
MEYYSDEDIARMKEKGCEEITIKHARKIQAKADALIKTIRYAFLGVKLEEGIGMLQAQGIDDYENEDKCQKLRAQDELNDWENISSEKLNKCYSSLSFFDSKGMKFHLPAYMIADIKNQYEFGLAFNLAHLSDYSKTQFEELNGIQRKAVRIFLEYMLENEEYEFEEPEIQRAISEFWSSQSRE